MSDAAREGVGEVVSSLVDDYTPGDVIEDWDLGELQTQVQQLWPLDGRHLGDRAGADRSRGPARGAAGRCAAPPTTTASRSSATRSCASSSARSCCRSSTTAGASTSTRWTTCARGSTSAGFAQIDPLVAYKNEGFSMFEALMHSIWEEFARLIFHVEVEVAPRAQEQLRAAGAGRWLRLLRAGPPSSPRRWARLRSRPPRVRTPPPNRTWSAARSPATGRAIEQETVVKDDKDKIGRNDPCWCGSGKKYKKCHGA